MLWMKVKLSSVQPKNTFLIIRCRHRVCKVFPLFYFYFFIKLTLGRFCYSRVQLIAFLGVEAATGIRPDESGRGCFRELMRTIKATLQASQLRCESVFSDEWTTWGITMPGPSAVARQGSCAISQGNLKRLVLQTTKQEHPYLGDPQKVQRHEGSLVWKNPCRAPSESAHS